MGVIKNIHKLDGLLTVDELTKLEAGASLHLRHSNIFFKIMSVNDNEVMLHAEQDKHLSENYVGTDKLVTLTKDLFGKFIPDRKIIVHPHVFVPAIVDIVDPQWIKQKMLQKGVRIKDIQVDTGIDKTNLSAWINGTRPMSQPVKSMFYFYLYRS